MKLDIIGVPTFYGCDNPGTEFGPHKLREKNIVGVLKEKGYEVNDLGDLNIEEVESKDKLKDSKVMKYLKPIVDMNEELAIKVHDSLNKGKFPLILGGDHSIAMGSIAGANAAYENIGVIWLDAHGDVNTYNTSDSKNVHGMPLAASMNIGHESLTSIYNKRIKVHPGNVFHLGGRDIDKGEQDLIDKIDSNFYTNKDMRKMGIDNCVNDVISKIKEKNLDAIHLSFDLDFIDSEYVPGTGTRVSEGFTVDETKHILSTILKSVKINSMDIVELNTKLDIDDTTANIAMDIVDHIF